MTDTTKNVLIDYINHAYVRQARLIVPTEGGFRFGTTEWHPEPQWLLHAYDVDKDDMRVFAVKDIHAWSPADTAAGRSMASVFKQLQRSVEKNGRLQKRLRNLLLQPSEHGAVAVSAIESILNDEDPS